MFIEYSHSRAKHEIGKTVCFYINNRFYGFIACNGNLVAKYQNEIYSLYGAKCKKIQMIMG
ncbi:hypothetical protein AMD27_06030 [Acinetobacter sp. TGL-Y2]|nr:hypothetical protein AMD27_06030 [Acinetobacter sp. TGL-Y2]